MTNKTESDEPRGRPSPVIAYLNNAFFLVVLAGVVIAGIILAVTQL